MRYALVAAAAALGTSAPASAALWNFNVSGVYSLVGTQFVIVACDSPAGVCPSSRPVNEFAPFSYIFTSYSQANGDYFSYLPSGIIGGYDFGFKSLITINYTVSHNRLFVTSVFAGSDPKLCDSNSPVGCTANVIIAKASSIGLTFLSSTDSTAPIPEPATWSLMITGFGTIGGAMRYRRRTAVTFA